MMILIKSYSNMKIKKGKIIIDIKLEREVYSKSCVHSTYPLPDLRRNVYYKYGIILKKHTSPI